MADRPILFSGPMVRAILDGRKTQTRRPMKAPPTVQFSTVCRDAAGMFTGDEWGNELERLNVHHAIGDRLWVRETWAVGNIYDRTKPKDINPGGQPGWCGIRYAATDQRMGIKDRPSIHMPRWASRITLIVTDVRVQRLRDIRPADILAEGATGYLDFSSTWDAFYGQGAWDSDPWVVATTFTAHHCNIDRLGA